MTVASASAKVLSPELNLDVVPLKKQPFEHVVVDGFIAPDLYAELCSSFPDCPPRIGPTGYSSYWGDPDYDALIASNAAWGALFKATHSKSFIDYCLVQLGPAFRRHGC